MPTKSPRPLVPAPGSVSDTPRTDVQLAHIGPNDDLCINADFARQLERELIKNEARLKWLHDCTNGNLDAEGCEWGIFRVKRENGRAVEVWQTNSDFSDLDAEMERECNSQNVRISQPEGEIK